MLLWSTNRILLLLHNFFKHSFVSLALTLYRSLWAIMPDIIITFLAVLTNGPRATISRAMASGVNVRRKSLVPQWSTMKSPTNAIVYFFFSLFCVSLGKFG